ncbi:MAG: hypothetical protein J0I06_12440, partial [Planctomycetes bacterium]|nr:hypothetical protein [Planctomycetota bacterium]
APLPPGPAPAATPAAHVQAPAPSTARVRAKGTGPTPEVAFRTALDDALRQAVATEVSAADWQRHGRDYLAALRQDGTGVVRGWQEVSSGSERRLVGRVFYSEVAVEVDLNVLQERLRSVGVVAQPRGP